MSAALDVTPPATSGWTRPELSKVCPTCREAFGPTRYPGGRSECASDFGLRVFCSKSCVRPSRTPDVPPAEVQAVSGDRRPPRPRRPAPVPRSPQTDPWQHSALCGDDPELFFGPDRERGPDRARREALAASICAACPVSVECLRYAMTKPRQEFGVWGGLGEDERRELARRSQGSDLVSATAAA